MHSSKKQKIIVAISGGIDSAASVLKLQEQGFFVQGVYFEMFEENGKGDAENVAKQLGIDLEIINLKDDFKERVLDNFFSEYGAGRTPNPCTICNQKIKFEFLLNFADKLGIKMVATGHYVNSRKDGKYNYIAKAGDLKKDQSYFLYRLKSSQLERIIFPLGHLNKEEIISYVNKRGIKIPKKESQDICFINSGEKVDDFLAQNLKRKKGDVLDENGEMVGHHDGAWFYTIGQRRGLSLNGGPYYIFKKDIDKNTLFVTKDKDSKALSFEKIYFENVSWIGREPEQGRKYTVKSRYLAREVTAQIKKFKEGYLAELEDTQWAVTPGQALVVFDGDLVLGGGVIRS